MNRRFSLFLALFIQLVTLQELVYLPSVIVAQCLSCLYVEHTLGCVFLGYLLCLVKQHQGLVGVVVQSHVHYVHIYRWDALIVSVFRHHVYHLVEAFLCSLLVAAVLVDVAHHVHGHIHLLVQLLLAQLFRQLLGLYVSLEDALPVHLEDNLVTALGVVAVIVFLVQQVSLQVVYMRIESGAVATVESMGHRVTKLLILRVLIIIYFSLTDANG